MGRYEAVQKDIFSVFNQNAWKNEGIKTYPANFLVVDPGIEYIRVSIIPSGQGINRFSLSGVLIVDIFTSAGNGPQRTSLIADKLDQYLLGKSLKTTSDGLTQFQISSLQFVGLDKHNTNLYRSIYTIPFNYFGV